MNSFSEKNPDAAGDGARAASSAAPEEASHPAPSAAGAGPMCHLGSFPTWGDLLAVTGIIFLATLAVGLLLPLARWIWPEASQTLLITLLYVLGLSLALLLVRIYRRRRGGRGSLLRGAFRGFDPMLVLWGFVLIFAVGVVIEPLLELFPTHYMERLEETIGRGGWSVLMTVLLAPLLEEVLFRGVLLESIRRKRGAVYAVLLSAAIFGAVHLIPQQAINAFFVGIVLGTIYVRTHSLPTVIALHALNNGVAYLAMLGGAAQLTFRSLVPNPTLYALLYLLAVAILVWAGWKMWRTLRSRPASAGQHG